MPENAPEPYAESHAPLPMAMEGLCLVVFLAALVFALPHVIDALHDLLQHLRNLRFPSLSSPLSSPLLGA